MKRFSFIAAALLLTAAAIGFFWLGIADNPSWSSASGDTAVPAQQQPSIEFPETLKTRFISGAVWPPTSMVTPKPLQCDTGDLRQVDQQAYCIAAEAEGAAGSIYTTYTVSTEREADVLTLSFVLRAVTCENYDPPQRDECKRERTSFDVVQMIHELLGLPESAAWSVYNDPALGLTFRYPSSVVLVDDPRAESNQLRLTVEAMLLDEMEEHGPLGFDKATFRTNRQALARGEYGEAVDMPLPASQKVRPVGGTHAQDFLVLGRFEVCDVTLERKLYLLSNEGQIIITLFGPVEEMLQGSARYFTVDPANCGEELIWRHALQEAFYEDLVSGTAAPAVQAWFDTFDEIAETVELQAGNAEEK